MFFKKKIEAYTDNELVVKYREDQNSAWLGELYHRYGHLVFGLCLKYLKDKENAKDATLAIFEKLITDLKSRDVATFQHWLYAVSKNYCLELLRSTNRTEKRKVVYHYETFGNTADELEVLSLAEMKEAGLKRVNAARDELLNHAV